MADSEQASIPISVSIPNPYLPTSPVTSRHIHSSHTPITSSFPSSTYNDDRPNLDSRTGLFNSALGITSPTDRKGKRRNSGTIGNNIPEETTRRRWNILGKLRGIGAGNRKRRTSLVLDVNDDEDDEGLEGRLEAIARIIALRLRPGLRKGNLPFVIIFIACLIIFVSALAGIGYTESNPNAIATANFRLGRPVLPGPDRWNGQQIMAQRKEMEEAWAKKKRPKDGAWMKKQRDDGALRRGERKEEDIKPIAKKEKAGEEKVEVEEKVKPAPIDPRILAAADKEAGYKE